MDKRFAISNGSRSYKLNKDVYNLKQNGVPINEYYTRISGIWEELSAVADLPRFTNINEEIANFLQALARQNEEHKLFQFLNGLNKTYATQRSKILRMNPSPSLESVCSMLQQEELQRQVLEDIHVQIEHYASALLSKNVRGQMQCL